MAYSRYQDCKSCKPVDDLAICKPKHPKTKKILLECGEGTGSRTFTSPDDAPFQLSHVTVDTTCLNRPEVLIKFSSLISMEVLVSNATVRLQYELFRVCDGGEPISLGTWMFEEVNVSSSFFDNIEESFSFIFCECQACHGCCEYFVTVTPVEIISATATVNNGRLAALSQSLCDSWEKYKYHDPKNKDTKFNQKHPKPKEILLECGQGNGRIIFRQAIIPQPPVNIAHVAIDTTCLSRPEVLIEFSSTIKLGMGILNLRLQFELFRVCGGEEPVSRGTWRFERTGTTSGNTEIDKFFSFIFCESLTCPGCCEYFVTVTVLEINTPGIQFFGLVDNGRMTALAQPSTDCCYHDNYEVSDENYDCINCTSKHPKPKKILLECGSSTGSKTFSSSFDETPFQLAHTTIDTTCLCKPVVNIEFSSIVSFENLTDSTAQGRLQYELFRVCDNGTPISLGVWFIDRINFLPSDIDKETNTFDFTFCDCITCPSCCDYFVTVTPLEIQNLAATVSNGRIAALAGEG